MSMKGKYESTKRPKPKHDKLRKCLKCESMFPSNGPWNRRCQKCLENEGHCERLIYIRMPLQRDHSF